MNEAVLNETAPLNEPKPFRLDPYEVEALKPKRNESIYEIDDEITKALKKGIDQNRAPQIKEQPEMPKIELSDETVRNLKPKPESDFSDYLANLNRANKNEFVGGNSARNNFVMKSDGKITYPYNAFLDIENKLADKLKLPKEQIRASLTYLYNNHPEMFDSKGDVYRTLKSLRDIHDYAGDSFKDNRLAYMASKLNDKKMNDVAISRDSGGAIHLNRNKRISGDYRELFNKPAARTPTLHSIDNKVSGAQMNTSQEHFSPTYAGIIPQNAKDLSKNPLLNFIKPENRPDISQNPFLNIDAKRNISDNNIANEAKNILQPQKLNKYGQGIKALNEIDITKLTPKQTQIVDVFKGKIAASTLQAKDLNDLVTLEQGSRNFGAKKIMVKHAGIQKTGGLSGEELANIEQVLKNGNILKSSFELFDDKLRYAYETEQNGIKLHLVVDEFNNGKKVFDYYSNRNFIEADKGHSLKSAHNEIIPQSNKNGNMKKRSLLFLLILFDRFV